ncbi:hypothetical protein A2U01_0095452, partial [Trifolium medium]|nr:hypothetical protein [Trifolium medium]
TRARAREKERKSQGTQEGLRARAKEFRRRKARDSRQQRYESSNSILE